MDEDERGIDSIYTSTGPRKVIVVNESGLYSLILGSRKLEAKKFKKGVSIIYTLKCVSSIHTLEGVQRMALVRLDGDEKGVI
jgi:hypothetical protein